MFQRVFMLPWPDGPVRYSTVGGDKLAKPKRRYNVFWKADDGEHFMGSTVAVSKAQACNNVHYRRIAGEQTIMLSNMFARLAETRVAEATSQQLELFS